SAVAALFLTLLPLVGVTRSAAGSVVDCTTDCFVDAVNGSDTLNHGTSTADAFQTIQKGIDTVTAGGTVHVAAGLYNPNNTDVTKSVALVGAKVGVNPVTTVRNPSDAAAESIIQSNIGLRITGTSAIDSINGFVFKEKTVGSSVGILPGFGPTDVG